MKCIYCEEEILTGETPPAIFEHVQNMHHECFLRGIFGSVGHLQKRCSCYGGTEEDPPDMTPRQAAKAAVELYRKLTQKE